MTGQPPPDAISRMKSDTMAKGLGAARMRYSAHLVDAIAWGLAMEDTARPRTVAQWREVLFGQKNLATQPQALKPKAAAVAGAKPAAQQNVSNEAQRAIAIASAMAESNRRSGARASSPWR